MRAQRHGSSLQPSCSSVLCGRTIRSEFSHEPLRKTNYGTYDPGLCPARKALFSTSLPSNSTTGRCFRNARSRFLFFNAASTQPGESWIHTPRPEETSLRCSRPSTSTKRSRDADLGSPVARHPIQVRIMTTNGGSRQGATPRIAQIFRLVPIRPIRPRRRAEAWKTTPATRGYASPASADSSPASSSAPASSMVEGAGWSPSPASASAASGFGSAADSSAGASEPASASPSEPACEA